MVVLEKLVEHPEKQLAPVAVAQEQAVIVPALVNPEDLLLQSLIPEMLGDTYNRKTIRLNRRLKKFSWMRNSLPN